MKRLAIVVALLFAGMLSDVALAKSSDSSDFSIIVNIPATELRFYENGELLRKIPVAVGQAIYPSPTKKVDKITHIIWNPWWIPPDSEWAKNAQPTPPGPGNPLGVVKMPLSNNVLLHGTDKPWSIGTPASHACIRMYNEDARSLAWTLQARLTPYQDENLLEEYASKTYKTVNIPLSKSVPVQFIYEPIEIEKGEIRLHRDLYTRIGNKRNAIVKKLIESGYDEENIDPKKLDFILNEWQKGKGKVTLSLKKLVGKS